MMLVQNYTTINQEDYYLLKEVTQASMIDAIDYNHYRQYEEVKINREKFIENFLRRFSESVKGNKNYKVDFYDIYETPPKVSVMVSTSTSSFNISGNQMELDVTNSIDAILENNSTKTITRTFYSIPTSICLEEDQDALGYCTIVNSPTLNSSGIKGLIIKDLQATGINDVSENDLKIVSSKFIGRITNCEEIQKYKENFENTYGDWEAYGHIDEPCHQDVFANELIDVKITITNNDVLSWTGKFKCENGHGIINPSNGTYSCNLGIKYELKFEYPND